MELEEMKTLWKEMSVKVAKQEQLTDQLIMEMTQQKYKNKFSKLLMYEMIGAVVCYIMALFVLVRIERLDTWYLMACGIFTVAFLAILPFFTIKSLRRIKQLQFADTSYKETLVRFAKSKKRLLFLQRFGLFLSPLFLLIVLPVMNKIMNNKDMFTANISGFPWFLLGIVLLGVILFSFWGYGWYKRITNSAEQLLRDLDEE